MARRIPCSFDIQNLKLDPVEKHVRDVLQVDITNWARFRHVINTGTDSSVLRSKARIHDAVRQAYLELGKTHHEIVASLGCAKQSYDDISKCGRIHVFYFRKALKEFYLHCSSILDNLARLIFIVCHPHSSFLPVGKRYKDRLVRHWVDWAMLRDKYPINGYKRILEDHTVREILNIRNNLMHNWVFPLRIDRATGMPDCPKAVRHARNYLWPYDK